jgi:hypothetical protein
VANEVAINGETTVNVLTFGKKSCDDKVEGTWMRDEILSVHG